jgi:hypothetical protein
MAYQTLFKIHRIEGTSTSDYEALSVQNYARHGLIPYYSNGCTCNPNSSGAGTYGLMQLVSDDCTSAQELSGVANYSVVCDGTNEKNEVKRILTTYNAYSPVNWGSTLSQRIVLASETISSNIKRYLCSGYMPYRMTYYFGVNRCDKHIDFHSDHFVNPFYFEFNNPYASVTSLETNVLNIYSGAYGKYALTSCIFGGMRLEAYGSSHPANPNAFSWSSALYADTPDRSKYIYSANNIEKYVAGYYPMTNLTVNDYAHGCVFGTITSPIYVDKSKLSIPVYNTAYSIASSNIKYLGEVKSGNTDFQKMMKNTGLFEAWDTTLKHVYIFYKDMYNVNIPYKRICTLSGVMKSS